ncbi:hypothetical protein HMPREF0290_0925 [Corynebacterium efficiens YS-314]|uniref:UPF0182 protein CE0802 n=1 Tax=Corynebacterium efficiens (strain DSM 44549 / YS-314 / AJ 12310 / JCM 11189 / NBRC 100395) TaxID=196164 RepID=Y802_COREF|nr:UPF0182 family protein [Corynebacterium efficiens]Q8FRF9.2 RecName: Full=UPF0182 protein CE0802 [Corynebacterium efficiens YS-314]EEW50477.1 hypothetical protein HMPREF0290_0925 [Corynebacterium efficiens YS-314]
MATGLTPPPQPIKRPPKAVTWIIGIIALLVLVTPLTVGFYTDWLWFGEVDYRGVFSTVIVTRIILFIVFALLAGFVTWLAGYFTIRLRPDDLTAFDAESPVFQYRQMIENSLRRILIIVPIFVGLLGGLVGQRSWQTVQLFLNREPFGVEDQQFGMDYGFYAFTLPMLRLITSSLSTLLVVAFIIALVGHYLLGGIRPGNQMTGQKAFISRGARAQLAVTAGLWMLVRVATYWLERYDLLTRENATFTGAGYTDINAHLPAKIILMVISIIVAVAFFSAIFLRDLRIPGLAVVLLVLSSVVVGAVWPLMLERFSVQPNRAEKESEYISRNIESTRFAYGITDDEVTYIENWGAGGATNAEVAADEATISNIRLLDPQILSPTFTQQQQLRNFYGFPEQLAMDRYEVDGELRDFVVAARELDPNSLQQNQQDWINRHTVYTHGNGFIAAQANQVDEVARDVGSTRGGYPVYTVSDLQTNARAAESEDAEELGIMVEQPRIYYGPLIASAADGKDYAIVGDTGDGPVEYDTDSTSYTYDGEGGVGIGNLFNRAAFALRYQEMNMILSDRVGSESKILFERDPRTRVEKVAPWLTTDSKSYPAVIDGSIKWIVDGYTTLSSLPYATRTSLTEATLDSVVVDNFQQPLLTEEVGYIRNSVKAVVDAYDGTVELYEFDSEDPVLKAWRGVFPDVVQPESEISNELRDHLRYPEDMFKVQREMLSRYHVEDAGTFFTNDAFWSVPNDPTAPEGRQEMKQPPYYVVAADPDTGESSFQLITPFRGLQREFLSAHMTASSDPDNFGKITVRVLPTGAVTQGPKQAQDAMMSSDQVAQDQTLWRGSNDLFNGNLLTLPVGGGEILYVEPIYSQRRDQESAFPKLLRMLVFYKGQVGYAPTIAEALSQVGIDPAAAQDIEVVEEDGTVTVPDVNATEDADATTDGEDETPAAPAAPAGSEAEGIEAINEALRNLEAARDGSFEEYGRALDALDRAVESYQGAGTAE